MSLDPYSLCPCGSGKKIKFCCCSDLASDLDLVIKMFAGEQRLACLKQVDKLIASGKDRAAFLATKARLEFELEHLEDAEKTVDRFLAKYPENPIALCQSAVIQAMASEGSDGVEVLQKALDVCDGKIPSDLLDAMDAVAGRLLADGKVIAARSHWMLISIYSEEDKMPAIVGELSSSPRVPLMIRAGFPVFPGPEEAPWKERFEKASARAARGIWLAAAEDLTELAGLFPHEPTIWNQVATLRCALGQNEAAVEALRNFAGLKRVSLENAVEAEAMAQLLEAESEGTVDLHRARFPVPDGEQLIEHLLSDPYAYRLPDGAAVPSDAADDVPPKAVFEILSDPKVPSMANVDKESIPQILGELYVYGKQTDHDARIEFILPATSTLEDHKSALLGRLGELVGSEYSSDSIGELPSIAAQLDMRFRCPSDASPDDVESLVAEKNAEGVLQRWPNIRMNVLEQRTPAEAAKIPALRTRLLACVLRLELAQQQVSRLFDVNRMRAQLGLPRPESIDPWKEEITQIPIWRIPRIDTVKMTDEQLSRAYRRAVLYGATYAMRYLGTELLARESLHEEFPLDVIYAMLSRGAYSTAESLDFLANAREAAVNNNRSPAFWLVAELPIRYRRGEAAPFEEIMNEIRLRYLDQPGVLEQLQQVLTQLGLIRPSDAPDVDPPEVANVAEPVESTSTDTGEIWTPESSAPAESDKSGIWVPGND